MSITFQNYRLSWLLNNHALLLGSGFFRWVWRQFCRHAQCFVGWQRFLDSAVRRFDDGKL